MRKFFWLGAALMLVACVAWMVQADEAKQEEHAYIGSSSCKACHNQEAKGQQFTLWENSPHAHAYETLLNEESQKIAAEMGLEQPAAEAPECLKCHVTAWDAKPELLGKKYDQTEGVGCESCHGPAKDWKISHMRDVEKAMTQGMIHPDAELCKTCHNEESPTYKPFSWEKKWPPIAHPNPQNEDE